MTNFVEFCLRADASSQHHFTPQSPVTCRSLSQQERSPLPEVHQLNLLALLEKPLESVLLIEIVPTHLTVGNDERFWLIHRESGLQVPGQFNRREAEQILETTKDWNWAVDPLTRQPACRWRLQGLLEHICSPQIVQGVAA